MKYTLKATGFSIDEALKKFVDQKITTVIKKFLKHENVLDAAAVAVEVGRVTTHHHKGMIWRAEANVSLPHSFLRCEAVAEDLREAIDLLSQELTGEIKKYKEKKVTIMKRGARRAKSERTLDPALRMRGARG